MSAAEDVDRYLRMKEDVKLETVTDTEILLQNVTVRTQNTKTYPPETCPKRLRFPSRQRLKIISMVKKPIDTIQRNFLY